MGTRAIRSRAIVDGSALRDAWRTHYVFNERLPSIIGILFKMRRCEFGENGAERELYQRIGQFITACSAQNADYLVNSISVKGWKPATAKKYKAKITVSDGDLLEIAGDSWADQAAELSAAGKLLFDKEALHGDLPSCMRQMLNREAVAIISGHDELTRNWHKAHREWLKRKADWEREPEHKLYLALRPAFDEFESEAGGQATKRRGRWHLYLDWLRRHPELAGWRGGRAAVQELDAAARLRVRRAKPWKQRSVEADEFWRVNPELRALDKLHGYYEREFIRRRKTKKNADGFDHRPTFTMPDPMRHPRWFVFNAPQTNPSGYRNLVIPNSPNAIGSVDLLLLCGDKVNGKYPARWATVPFRADPRLSQFRKVMQQQTIHRGEKKGQPVERAAFRFRDKQLNLDRPAQISGIKLILQDVRLDGRGSPRSAAVCLVFTCSIDDLPLSEKAKAVKWNETGEITKKGKKRKTKTLPAGLVSYAVDLDTRGIGFGTLAISGVSKDGETHDGVRVLRSQNLRLVHKERSGMHPGRVSAGPELAHIGFHKRTLKRLRRLRGKPVSGEATHVELQSHVDNMGEDRFKKGARLVVNSAINTCQSAAKVSGEILPRADVLLLENLENLLPDAERERGINSTLIKWNRGQLVKRIKELAADAGLKVYEVSPIGTSQVCCRCGSLGRRYSIERDTEDRRPIIRFGPVERLFACPACGYRANSDHNASVNLHRRFALDDRAVQSYFAWKNKPEPERKAELEGLENQLRQTLEREHRLPLTVPEMPW